MLILTLAAVAVMVAGVALLKAVQDDGIAHCAAIDGEDGAKVVCEEGGDEGGD